ncbi:hypothetical protein GJ744_003637 [Endocarpon pusillum]|uniref:Apple domain-containing protein n=1 Tax=Endocarpon pusillum TaxID=364733 RepID=A0A8H7A8X2_9EURO|nr:hypothetical protein GJ744_003637 [Endocarpon pusillum]
MKLSLYGIGALLAALTTCIAAPTDVPEDPEAKKKTFDCNDRLVVKAFSKYPSLATSLCSSYVPATTTTEVVVSTSTPTPPTQITTTVPLTATITETVTVTTPDSPITYIYNAPFPSNTKTILPTPPSPAKRSVPADEEDIGRGLPPWVTKYASAEISSGCSCFGITPSIKTLTSTSVTVAPTPTITATVSETATTTTVTETTTVLGPRPTVGTCADYQSSPLNRDYSWLSPTDLNVWTVQTFYGLNLIDCCNKCYQTLNCISYKSYSIYGYTSGCDIYTLPGNGALGNPYPVPKLLGYNQQCPLGVFQGTRQLNAGPQLAIGPCLDANYLN